MIVNVRSAAELRDLGGAAIGRALAGDDAHVDLRLAPGRYEDVAVTLGTEGRLLRRVSLCAADPDDPPQLADLSMRLRAEHVRVEDLAISRTRRGLPVVALEGERLELIGCAMIGCQLDSPPGGRLVELVAIRSAAATAKLDGCWFVDNHAGDRDLALIGVEGRPYGFELIELTDTAFVANRAPVTILPRAQMVCLTRCLAVAPVDGPADAVFLALTAPDSAATFDECVLAWPAVGGLVAPSREHAGAAARISRSVLACAPGESAAIKLDDVTFAAPVTDAQPVLRLATADAGTGARPNLEKLAWALGIGAPAET